MNHHLLLCLHIGGIDSLPVQAIKHCEMTFEVVVRNTIPRDAFDTIQYIYAAVNLHKKADSVQQDHSSEDAMLMSARLHQFTQDTQTW